MLWKALALLSNSPIPIVVVTSESMEPAFQRGDLLFLWNRDASIAVGDLAVCWSKGRKLPMVHRGVRKFATSDSTGSAVLKYLTKGDNNDVDDTLLYPGGQSFIDRKDVMELVRGYVPYIGRLVNRVERKSRDQTRAFRVEHESYCDGSRTLRDGRS